MNTSSINKNFFFWRFDSYKYGFKHFSICSIYLVLLAIIRAYMAVPLGFEPRNGRVKVCCVTVSPGYNIERRWCLFRKTNNRQKRFHLWVTQNYILLSTWYISCREHLLNVPSSGQHLRFDLCPRENQRKPRRCWWKKVSVLLLF